LACIFKNAHCIFRYSFNPFIQICFDFLVRRINFLGNLGLMKKILIIFFIIIVHEGNACTTFFINKNGQMIFGRNYDWITGAGMVCTNLRGLQKTSMKMGDGTTISWVSTYGSITFNQYGKEFPTGGMNEKGLVVELMWLDETKYPEPDKRPAIGVLQWIQYQLDCSATIDEIIATDSKLRITSKDGAPLHYLVADANGNVATIEFLNGKMTVHKGKDLPFPVLTNNTYQQSVQKTNGSNDKYYSDNSIDRFANACSMVKQFQSTNINEPIVDYGFKILEKVTQPNWTKWSIVYDITNKKIYFKTADYTDLKNLSFSSFDLSCASSAKAFNMNQQGKDNIDSKFKTFTIDEAKPILETAIHESKSQVTISDDSKEAILNYNKGVKCK
jgi:penicillin V acylase-like amidase (Ntn superfamily)